MPMDLRYVWKFSLQKPNLTIHMPLKPDHEEHCFDATLQLKAQEMNRQSMRHSIELSVYDLSVVILIYWQALRCG